MTDVEYPRWKFRPGTADAPVDAVLVSNDDEATSLGEEWQDSRAEVVKGTQHEGARFAERHLELHQVLNAQKPAETTEVVTDAEH